MVALIPTLFAVAGLLALVSLLPPLAQRLRLPLAVLLAAVGTLIGAALHVAGRGLVDGIGPLADFLQALEGLELSSAAFIYLFLPVLLFDMALSVDVRRLLDDFWPILLLAVVAVLVSTFVAGLAVWFAAGFWHGELGFVRLVTCLLLAAIVATTDPAAVVGIFRDLGAPRRLSILVEGESLFNDAAAIALFTVLLAMVIGQTDAGPGDATLIFIQKFLGGLAVGWALGWLVGLVVTPLRDLPQSEITLTVALSYLSFILAETYLEVSGVVAVVTAGLVMGSQGRTRISPESWEGLRHVWAQLGFWANSLIFLLASMLIPPTLMEATPGHLVLMAALILGALAARAAVIFGLIPVLTSLGAADRISRPYMAVMLWGGLRGAVSLTLALAVTESRRVPDDVQNLVAVAATGFVLFTLFVQGTTLRPLIRLLRLDQLSPVDLNLRNRALGLSLGNVRKEIEAAAANLHMDPTSAIQPLMERGAQLAQEQLDLDARYGALSPDDRIYIGLSTLARREEELYLEYFRDGIISRAGAQRLAAQAGRLQDGVKTGRRAGYETAARMALRHSRALRHALLLHRHLGWERPLAARLAEFFADLMVWRQAVGQLQRFADERLTPMLGYETADELVAVLRTRLAGIEETLAALRLQYPAYIEAVQVRHLARAGLRYEERTLRDLHAEGLISHEILADLERDLRRRRAELDRPPHLDLGLATSDLIARVPLFAGLPAERLKPIERLLRPRLAVPGEVLVRRGEQGSDMFFISSGAVAVQAPGLAEPVRLGSGDFFGEMSLLFEQPRNADVVALAYSRLLVLDRRDFNRLYRKDTALRVHLQDVAGRRIMAAETGA